MPEKVVFLDESGDLGWNFSAPFRQGGSSRHLTIGALLMPKECLHYPKRVIRRMYEQYSWDSSKEVKGSELTQEHCENFAEKICALTSAQPGMHLRCLTVKKENVLSHIRRDPNKLYNYMVKILLGDYLAQEQSATVYHDERSVKLKSGNSLGDYLTMDQWFTRENPISLTVLPVNSKSHLNVRIADFLAHITFGYFEDGHDHGFSKISAVHSIGTLYFSSPSANQHRAHTP